MIQEEAKIITIKVNLYVELTMYQALSYIVYVYPLL